jgi:hypothetical protein
MTHKHKGEDKDEHVVCIYRQLILVILFITDVDSTDFSTRKGSV